MDKKTKSIEKSEVLLISKSVVESVMGYEDYVEAMRSAFLCRSQGSALKPGLMHTDMPEGEFHIKCGGMIQDRSYFAIKANGGFFDNQVKHGLPNIIGLITLFDGSNGRPLAILDSTEITSMRTAATTALAAQYLSKPRAKTVLICGTGNQARYQLRALTAVQKSIQKIYVWGLDNHQAKAFAQEMTSELAIEVKDILSIKSVSLKCEIIITCTTAKHYFLDSMHISPGTFISAVGADSPEKQEISPILLGKAKVVVDILEQCASVGELHHALTAGVMRVDQVYGELGDVVSGKIQGRENDHEIIIFDTTGSAIQDAAAASHVYEKVVVSDKGVLFNLYR